MEIREQASRLRSFISKGPIVRSPFPPIADYAFLSDCHVSALIASSGKVEWMCVPRMDSPAVFAAMLDRDAGSFHLGPAGMTVPAGRRYLPGTMVLETTWMARTGWVIVRDALSIGIWHHELDRSHSHVRSPTDHDAENVLLRTVKCVNGSVELNLDCDPVFDYGRIDAEWSYVGTDYHEAVAEAPGSDVKLRLTSDMRIGFEAGRAHASTTLKEGETAFAALAWSEGVPPKSYDEAFERMETTSRFWRDWLAVGQFPDHPWRVYLQRSALTLKGLTYAPTGAMVAAPTTSLPETPRGERNWDYRYAWIRDSTFLLWGLYSLGFDKEANEFFFFIAEILRKHPEIQIMYGIGGERQLDESTLDHLSGYDSARPVRIGNAAYLQAQHDVWGSVLDSVYLHTKSRESMPRQLWPILKRQVEDALAHWREPDSGLWEVRGEPKHFTSSKLMCWVAADRGARLAALREETEYATQWAEAADEIHADICANGLDTDRDVFTQHYETKALDASLLMMPLLRFLPAEDRRIRNTVLTIADELTEDGLVLRYRVDETDDGLSGEEGTFTICSFWLVSALAEIGEIERARKLCEKLLGYASELRLYAEEIEASTGRHLGNFPQAFTHLALINAVTHVIRADEQSEVSRFSMGR